jgi:hypothetical protein
MKEFYNIIEAGNYHKKCYRCSGSMRIYFHGDPVDGETFLDHRDNICQTIKINLSLGVDSDTDDILTIDPVNNRISLQSLSRRKYFDMDQASYDGEAPLKSYSNYGKFNGSLLPLIGSGYGATLYESLTICCSKCYNFNYAIQVVIDTEINRIKHLFLNSEHIIWTDRNNSHEIRNVYATGQTECTLFRMTDKCQRITVPIIPLNLFNPDETMQRIKKLNIFS